MTLRVQTVKLMRALGVNKFAARLYYKHIHGFNSAGKELPEVVHKCLKRAIETGISDQGDYCEFGIFKGHTFLRAQMAANKLGIKNMRFFGFDSFEGLPKPEGIDVTEEEHFYAGQYEWPIEAVRKELDAHGADWNRTFLVKGYFNDTLTEETRNKFGIESVPIALVDGDLYSSTVDSLKFFENLIIDNSMLIMDDWGGFDMDEERGQQRALAEFLHRNPQWKAEPWFSYGSYGQVFIIRTNEDAGTVALN